MKHPIQKIYTSDTKVVRFQPNEIVRHILDKQDINLNDISSLDFNNEDRSQFAQLIGYSVSGWSELPYVSADECKIVDQKQQALSISDLEAENKSLRKQLITLRILFAKPMAELYDICEEDLI